MLRDGRARLWDSVWPKANVTVAWGNAPGMRQIQAYFWPKAIFTTIPSRDDEYGLRPNKRDYSVFFLPGAALRLPQATVNNGLRPMMRRSVRSINRRTLIYDRHAMQDPCRVIARDYLVSALLVSALPLVS